MCEIFDGKFREVYENFPRNFLSLLSSHLAKLEGSLLVSPLIALNAQDASYI